MECLKKSMPQIIMLSHMAHVNRQRLDKRMAADKVKEKAQPREDSDPPIWMGKRLSELTTKEYEAYSKQF